MTRAPASEAVVDRARASGPQGRRRVKHVPPIFAPGSSVPRQPHRRSRLFRVMDARSSPRANALRVLAHPLRARLLARLRLAGPATATELAAHLNSNTGATSYHLRRLEAGLLVRDTGTGDKRRRVWEAVEFGSSEAEPRTEDEVSADVWLQRDYLEYFASRADLWITRQPQCPVVWQRMCGLKDRPLLITAEQLVALDAELVEVFARYRRIGAGSPGARRVTAYIDLLPIDFPAVAPSNEP